jgi:hypothetical protein
MSEKLTGFKVSVPEDISAKCSSSTGIRWAPRAQHGGADFRVHKRLFANQPRCCIASWKDQRHNVQVVALLCTAGTSSSTGAYRMLHFLQFKRHES